MINLDNEIVRKIVNVLVMTDPESEELYLQSIKNGSRIGTQNSIHKYRWDYRYNSIIEICNQYGLDYIKLSRGKLWEAVLVRSPENEIYTFFSHSNLERIINNRKENHYLKLLNLFNSGLDDLPTLNHQQLTFQLLDESEVIEDKNDLKQLAKEMLHMMETEPSKVIVFAFDATFIPTVYAYAFNSYHQLVQEVNLTEFIDTNYHAVLSDKKAKPEERESSNINSPKREKKRIVQLKA